MHPRAAIGLRALGWWGAVALVFATQGYLTRRVAGEPITVLEQLHGELFTFGPWMLLGPVVFAAVRRFPMDAGRARNLLVLLGVGAGVAMAHALFGATFAPLPDPIRGAPLAARYLFVLPRVFGAHLLAYAALVAIAHAAAWRRASEARAVRESQLEATLATAELGLLRMQLHPHFLFNTLHAISALMATDVPGARRMIARLSDLLRLSLDGQGSEQIPLGREIEHLELYVAIQKVRFRDRLTVDLDIARDVSDARVPGLILQPLVENAVRHGIEPRAAPGRVAVAARRREDRLQITVEDDGVGLPGGLVPREGVGLRNTRARLDLLHGDDHLLTIQSRSGGGTSVTIDIPFTRSGDPGTERTDDAAHRADR